MESLEYILGMLFKKENVSFERLEKNRIRAAIEKQCEEHLQDFDDVFTFEALPRAIDNTLLVIEEPALTSKYDFEQISATLFRVRLKELDII